MRRGHDAPSSPPVVAGARARLTTSPRCTHPWMPAPTNPNPNSADLMRQMHLGRPSYTSGHGASTPPPSPIMKNYTPGGRFGTAQLPRQIAPAWALLDGIETKGKIVLNSRIPAVIDEAHQLGDCHRLLAHLTHQPLRGLTRT